MAGKENAHRYGERQPAWRTTEVNQKEGRHLYSISPHRFSHLFASPSPAFASSGARAILVASVSPAPHVASKESVTEAGVVAS